MRRAHAQGALTVGGKLGGGGPRACAAVAAAVGRLSGGEGGGGAAFRARLARAGGHGDGQTDTGTDRQRDRRAGRRSRKHPCVEEHGGGGRLSVGSSGLNLLSVSPGYILF